MNKVKRIPAKLEELLNTPALLLSIDKFDEKKRIQLVKVFESFYESPKTMMEAAVNTNVMRSNICYYVGALREARLIAELGKRCCFITGYMAAEHTTNPELFPFNPQSQIFTSVTSH